MGTEQKERPNCQRNTYYYFTNFCDSTSIHGFKFVGEHGRFWIEKIWWIIVVSLAFSGASWLIYKSYDKWVNTPVLVSFAAIETPISKIPFPAVTICPEIKTKSTVFNYTRNYLKYKAGQKLSEEEKTFYDIVSLMCQRGKEFSSNYIEPKEFAEIRDKLYSQMVTNCQWLGENVGCTEILQYEFTTDGWCFTFNGLTREEMYNGVPNLNSSQGFKINNWSVDGGYKEGGDINTAITKLLETDYPKRTQITGLQSGFQVDLLVNHEDLDYACSDLQGFKVTLHHPAEMPNMDTHFRVPLDQAVIAAIRPKMITTTDDIKGYPVRKRDCYVSGERSLMTFQNYTQQNCVAECINNVTIFYFNCSHFHLATDDQMPICGAGIQEKESYKLYVGRIMRNLILLDSTEDGDADINCYCLPSCTSLEYDTETTQSVWDWRRSYHFEDNVLIYGDVTAEKSNFFEKSENHMSRLIVYYKEFQFISTERHELYGVVDFLANCGGLVGLFCGLSFTSIMEILYYLTLRLVCNFKKFGRRIWSGAPELMDT